jgi:hypothetical protein
MAISSDQAWQSQVNPKGMRAYYGHLIFYQHWQAVVGPSNGPICAGYGFGHDHSDCKMALFHGPSQPGIQVLFKSANTSIDYPRLALSLVV